MRLQQRLGEVRPIPIASPTDFICVPSVWSAPGNFSKAKRGNDDDVVEGSARSSRASSSSGRWGSRRACNRPRASRRPWRSGSRSPWRRAPRSASPRVHLDDAQLTGLAAARELDVRAARLDADRADDGAGRVAQLLCASSGSVICGATVTESPVCTPIGSRFSIEQTMTTLSARSRMTSSSNSSHPRTDSSTSTCPIGDSQRPRSTWCASVARSSAKPPPWPRA